MSDLVNEVNGAVFREQVLEADRPVVVDFWATWCGPCKAIAPVLEDLAKVHEGKVKIVKVNVENDPDLATEYGVTMLPSLLFFKGGKVEQALAGAVARSKIEQTLQKVLG